MVTDASMGPAIAGRQRDDIRTPLHDRLLGKSIAIREASQLIHQLAQSKLTVLVTGESGTGKDIAARLLHRLSPRQGKPFMKVNCPAIPESIIESELFGYEKGAFTGARTSKPGRFELANHGSIFLDEIAETPKRVQGKLLQVLDGEPVMRIGGTSTVETDVRLIAATNVDLEKAVREGRMREDIYFRLCEVVVHMPPLRERPEDIPILAEHFNYAYCNRFEKEYTPLPDDVVADMQTQYWRGNVRELGTRVKNYVVTGDVAALVEPGEDEVAGGDQQSPHVQGALPSGPIGVVGAQRVSPQAGGARPRRETPRRDFPPLKEAVRQAVEQTERKLIEEALQYTLWNRRRAAKLLKISYSSLLRRIDAYGLNKSE